MGGQQGPPGQRPSHMRRSRPKRVLGGRSTARQALRTHPVSGRQALPHKLEGLHGFPCAEPLAVPGGMHPASMAGISHPRPLPA
eukprot:10791630-Heterocapsa_arctica.AAC.1